MSAVGFAEHIKPLFRVEDRDAMDFAFDLWSYDDVAMHADDIMERVSEGSMPCDTEWSAEKVALLQQWIDAGKPE